MIPAIKNQSTFRSEIMTTSENDLVLECALQIAKGLEVRMKQSRNLKEIEELKFHQRIVNRMMANIH